MRDKIETLLPALNERQQRLFLAAEAKYLGRGGVTTVARIAQVSRVTVYAGLAEIERPVSITDADTKIRKEGGGRKAAIDSDPSLLKALNDLLSAETRGDPESPLLWTCKSCRQLSGVLKEQGYNVSHQLVGRLLNDLGYSLQGNSKTLEGTAYEHRDEQFRHIARRVSSFQAKGQPAISVDTKKKELVGNFKNQGREYRPKGEPVETQVHDFLSAGEGRAVPYGVYDVTENQGWVGVGTSFDTAEFAVATIGRWWEQIGKATYPDAKQLLISADCGGSNGYRNRLWKLELARLADRTGLEIHVCHLPPGTSKWNKIEHRLFSFISMNWRGRPLTSFSVIVELIAATKTKTGLSVRSELDPNTYQKGLEVPPEVFSKIPIEYKTSRTELNYVVKPGLKL
ncbi:MAG: ISAzo13 family transposase [Candidatus Eremiobacteraeota bacterium]|nr:ISAzo13 family transposase [Candidatus Eremiobacteraeota bacterium]